MDLKGNSLKLLIYAVGIAMFFEGAPYLLLPRQARSAARMLSEMSDNALRIIGGVLVFFGFLILYLI